MMDTEYTIVPLGGMRRQRRQPALYTVVVLLLEFKKYAMVGPLTFFFFILFFVHVQLVYLTSYLSKWKFCAMNIHVRTSISHKADKLIKWQTRQWSLNVLISEI